MRDSQAAKEEITSLTKEMFEKWVIRDPTVFKEFLAFFPNEFTGFGSGTHEIFEGKDSLKEYTLQEHEEVPETPEVTFQWIRSSVFGRTAVSRCLVNVKILVEGHYHEWNDLRWSLTWHKHANRWKIVHSHCSMPYALQQEGEQYPLEELKARNRELENLVSKKTEDLRKEKEKTESLLHNILPIEVAKELLETGSVKPAKYDEVSILFSDFKEFTNIVATIPTRKLISELNELFSRFDDIMESEGIEKIQTVGDAYLGRFWIAGRSTGPCPKVCPSW